MDKIVKALLFFIISGTVFAACASQNYSPTSEKSVGSQQQSPLTDHRIIPLVIGETTLSVEVVTTAASITKGLGYRDEIGSDGMLFLLPERTVAHFWMHGMRFPLDLIWIDNGRVVGIVHDIPAPADPESFDLPSYSSEVPVTQVLELPAGKAQQLGIKVGDQVSW